MIITAEPKTNLGKCFMSCFPTLPVAAALGDPVLHTELGSHGNPERAHGNSHPWGPHTAGAGDAEGPSLLRGAQGATAGTETVGETTRIVEEKHSLVEVTG